VYVFVTKTQGANSQNFLRQIHKIFVTLRCLYKAIIHRKWVIYYFYFSLHQNLRISVLKLTAGMCSPGGLKNFFKDKVKKITTHFRVTGHKPGNGKHTARRPHSAREASNFSFKIGPREPIRCPVLPADENSCPPLA